MTPFERCNVLPNQHGPSRVAESPPSHSTLKVGGMQVDTVGSHLFKDTQSRLLTSVGACCLQLLKLGCFSQAKKCPQTEMNQWNTDGDFKRTLIYLFLSFSSDAQGPRLVTLIKPHLQCESCFLTMQGHCYY